jgi:hypothetical protein
MLELLIFSFLVKTHLTKNVYASFVKPRIRNGKCTLTNFTLLIVCIMMQEINHVTTTTATTTTINALNRKFRSKSFAWLLTSKHIVHFYVITFKLKK